VSVYVEGAGKNIFLIEGNVQKQLSQERFWPLRVPGIKDAVTAVGSRYWLALRAITLGIGLGGAGFCANRLASCWLDETKKVIAGPGGSNQSPCKYQYLE